MASRNYETPLPFPPELVRAWHERPGAFARLQPPWDSVDVIEAKGTVFEGDRLVMRVAPMVRWVAVHRPHADGFVDEMESGPFGSWRHVHRFVPDGTGGTIIHDEITFTPALLGPLVDRKLAPMFSFRRRRLLSDLKRHVGQPKLRVLVTGASGLVGSALTAFLSTGGHEVFQLVRKEPGAGQVHWRPDAGYVDEAALSAASGSTGFDAVISLGGESVGERRWSEARKQALVESRLRPTALLGEVLERLAVRPRAWISASAVGFYGQQVEDEVDERSPGGVDFLADLCRRWEETAALPGCRMVYARLGVVLSAHGGALQRLLPLFRAGGGGPVGRGTQHFPWIGLDDAVYALTHIARDPALSGPANLVAPGRVRQREFATMLGRCCGMPAVLPLPAAAVTLAFGEMGSSLLLGGQNVVSRSLAGRFEFQHPTLEQALAGELGLPDPSPAQA